MIPAPQYHPEIDQLAPRVLHGLADDAERALLGRLLARSAPNRQRFLDHSALHSMLALEAKAGGFAADPERYFRDLESPAPAKPGRLLRFWLPAAAALVVAALIAIPLMPVPAAAALDRVRAAIGQGPDRTYRITVLDPADSGDAPERRENRGRYPVGKHLDGATLWLRGPGQFVLRQSLPNGETRILGSDGTESWSVRGSGDVEVDGDPGRFGGGLVAKRPEIAFVDLNGQLEELKTRYRLEWLDRKDATLWKLRGTRRSVDHGGARAIELWFEPDSGLLRRIILRDLPRENGGPRGIMLTLESTSPLAADFFHHSHPHHPQP